jgi:aspartate racemase
LKVRTLGLIGGMSAESTALYYRELNRRVAERLGGLHSARLILWSVDFAPIAELQAKGDWAATGAELAEAARRLEAAGAEALLICANTMHINAPQVEAAVKAPLIHIGDATAAALKAKGVRRPLLLGTRFTMEMPFYAQRLREAGLEPMTPDAGERTALHAIIYDELVKGVVREDSRAAVLGMIDAAKARGADGAIFGCTEIGMLLDPDAMPVPTVDTTIAHCQAAVEFALS